MLGHVPLLAHHGAPGKEAIRFKFTLTPSSVLNSP